VWCDTDIIIGHLRTEAEIVTAENRQLFMAQDAIVSEVTEDWVVDKWLEEYRTEVKEYTGLTDEDIVEKAIVYNSTDKNKFEDYKDPKEYYKNLGVGQLCRQVLFHSKPRVALEGLALIKQFRPGRKYRGIDFGCGSAPVGFQLLKTGYEVDFVDIDGAPGYEFLKWRVEKSEFVDKAGWDIKGPYEFALFLDVIEHLKDWEQVLDNVIGRMVEKGVFFTNYLNNRDFNNPEHINMDHNTVIEFLMNHNMIPKSDGIWIKDDNYMGAMNMKTEKGKK
jgi:hypothetical protein